MQMENKYNRHLCKKIDKLEDFTVEYKNDPFKALKLFIDSYLWLKDPSKNKFPEELVGQSAIAIEKYVRNVIKTTSTLKGRLQVIKKYEAKLAEKAMKEAEREAKLAAKQAEREAKKAAKKAAKEK